MLSQKTKAPARNADGNITAFFRSCFPRRKVWLPFFYNVLDDFIRAVFFFFFFGLQWALRLLLFMRRQWRRVLRHSERIRKFNSNVVETQGHASAFDVGVAWVIALRAAASHINSSWLVSHCMARAWADRLQGTQHDTALFFSVGLCRRYSYPGSGLLPWLWALILTLALILALDSYLSSGLLSCLWTLILALDEWRC